MAQAPTYSVTVEISEMELALLYHTVMEEQEEYRPVFWKGAGKGFERRYVSRRWLENKLFGRIAEMQPEWLTAMEEARQRLSLHAE
jgi:hypothetical protein